MSKDQDVLDIIQALNRDLRHNDEFCALLHEVDDETSRRITQSYLEWLCRVLELGEQPVSGHRARRSHASPTKAPSTSKWSAPPGALSGAL